MSRAGRSAALAAHRFEEAVGDGRTNRLATMLRTGRLAPLPGAALAHASRGTLPQKGEKV